MWGIIPAAGIGSRIQPLAFSKELLPVGSRFDGQTERPRAVSEYLVDRMLRAGATRLCFVISPGKSDILEYYGAGVGPAAVCYVVQERPGGLCDAVFRACPLIGDDEPVLIGLPDTVWFPEDGLARLPGDAVGLLLFPVEHPECFDAVIHDDAGAVREIRVKQRDPGSSWIWGAMRMPGSALHRLRAMWDARGRRDEYLGTLFNAYIEAGGRIVGVRAGEAYVDVGTLHGYREAIGVLSDRASPAGAARVVGGPAESVAGREAHAGRAPTERAGAFGRHPAAELNRGAGRG